jgi:stage II sporulation protein D
MNPRTALSRAGVAAVLTAAFLTLDGGAPAGATPGLVVPKGATVVIHGRGYGHGHGMSQYGAQGAAKQGRSTRQILGFYYPKTDAGHGEFRSTGRPLTLVLGGTRTTYRGTLRSMAQISRTTHRIIVNKVSLEGYVQGVVPREMPSSWRPAALRAQAVAARTYAAYEVGHSYDPRFNLCDSTSCQVYGGLSAEVASTNRATAATAGQVRTYQGHPAFTQFSASNGGWLAAGSQPYLVAKHDPYDTGTVDPYASWKTRVTARRIQHTWPALGRLRSIEVNSRDGNGRWGGRIVKLTLHGTQADKQLSGDEFRGALGLRSTWLTFTIAGSGG